ncbi:MAG: hypothetical protein JW797_01400 [Bradymonadales bacterium]|nr:hypothetical protein [Bradymonadales bacterium]
MKRPFVLAFVFLLATPAALFAQEAPGLGRGDIALKLGYIAFPQNDSDEAGIYLGLAGYGHVGSNVYVGGELGPAGNIGFFSDDMSMVSFELNAKYALGVGSHFVVAGGGGLCLAYAEIEDYSFFSGRETYQEWLFGGQVFADLVFRFGWFDFGFNVKYQLLSPPDQEGVDFSNFRLGPQIGIVF